MSASKSDTPLSSSRHVWQLAWPTIISNLLFTTVGFAHIKIVAELGTTSVAAVTTGHRVFFLIQAILAGNSGWIVQVLTWVPLWTPFTVLARLGMGIEWWEMVGSGVLLAGAIVIELVLIGRLFRASLLSTGQKPSLKRVIERLRASPAR